MKDLAPHIYRQRLIIEATLKNKIGKKEIDEYLIELSKILKMTIVRKPLTKKDPGQGYSSYVYWEESGTHLYYWEKPLFLSIDIYTCKQFTVSKAINYTKKFFTTKEIVHKKI